MYERVVKRFFDIIISFFALIFLSPIMLIVAIAIKCESKGPAVFKTERIGRNQKSFKFYKFRSMRTDAPKDVHPSLLKAEDYLTKTGKFIRKTSIDELPQLWCILKGDMSIIGCRPCGFHEQELCDERERLGVHSSRPGLTGLAQINGRDILAIDVKQKAKYDAEYCNNITFINDCKIFFQTILKVFKSEDIVEGAAVVNKISNAEGVEVGNAQELLLVNDGEQNANRAKEILVSESNSQAVAEQSPEKGDFYTDNDLQEVASELIEDKNSEQMPNETSYRNEVIEELKESIIEVRDKNAADNIA